MNNALWIDRCTGQIGRRWPSITAQEAALITSSLAEVPASRELEPEAGADAYVRSVEERQQVVPSAFVLRCVFDGASDEQRARAVAAAEEVFRQAGVTPAGAARGYFSRSCWDDAGFVGDDEPTQDEFDAAFAWDRAETAAFDACGSASEFPPRGAGLELLWRSGGA